MKVPGRVAAEAARQEARRALDMSPQLDKAFSPAQHDAKMARKRQQEADGEEAIMACVLAYRVQRKKLWEVAIDVLEAHVETHSPTSQEAAPQKVQEDAE